MNPSVLALDLSLTATGVALPDGRPMRLNNTLRGAERLIWIRDRVIQMAMPEAVEVVAIEGFAFGRPNQAHHIGGLGWVIRVALTEMQVPWCEIPPASVKKYATGKGNAKKADVLAAAIRRLDYNGSDDNEADALWLRALVLDKIGHPVVIVPELHREALVKITVPYTA